MQETQNNSLGAFEAVILLIFVGIILSPFINSISTYFLGLKQSMLAYFITLKPSLTICLIILAIYAVLFLIIVFIYKILKSIFLQIARAINDAIIIKRETIEIESFLLKDYEVEEKEMTLEIEKIRDKINICNDYEKLKHFRPKLKKRLETCLQLLAVLKKRHIAESTNKEIEQNKRYLKDLDEEIRIKSTYEESDADMICSQLRTWENIVFIKSKLSKNQVNALEKKGYKQTNEYSVKENKFIRVLVKPDSNHSKTHAFLVWDTIRLLKDFKGVKNIQEHETVDADITFNFNNKRYALEIERGDLLRKKKQAQEKVEWLNRKYRKRWMFIVSNKNFLQRYQELGFSTQRKQVSENLKIMLEK